MLYLLYAEKVYSFVFVTSFLVKIVLQYNLFMCFKLCNMNIPHTILHVLKCNKTLSFFNIEN